MALRFSQQPETSQRHHPARLVLLVGAAFGAGSDLARSLALVGMRCLRLRGVAQMIATARLATIDAVVLDSSAFAGRIGQVLPQVRQQLDCPIIVVTQHADEIDEIDEIVALELGADAFLVRPLAPRRLRAHLAALLRPSTLNPVVGSDAGWSIDRATPAPATRKQPSLAGWALDTRNGRLTGSGCNVELTVLQSALMLCLMDAAGEVVSSSHLTAALPGGQGLAANSVYVYVARLRRKLLAEGVHELRIEAHRGRGFALRVTAPGADLRPPPHGFGLRSDGARHAMPAATAEQA